MRFLGNILWFVLGGWLLFILYTLAAIIFLPMFLPLWRLALYSAWPLGRDVVSQRKLEKYREITGKHVPISDATKTLRASSGVFNAIWLCTFGWILALGHLLGAVLNVFAFFLIVTIPNIPAHWKLMPVALMPFNKVVLPWKIVEEINETVTREKHNL